MITNLLLKFNLENYKGLIESFVKTNNNSIYTGKAGAILYLLELYQVCTKQEVLDDTLTVAKSIQIDTNASYAFYTGNMGVAYAFLELYKITKDEDFLANALSIAKDSKNHLSLTENSAIELLNGVSGILLGLIHIYNSGVKDIWLVKDIKFYVDYMISKTELGNEGGFFWDKSYKNNQGLTGFSHGASGIGFVFNQLYKITSNESFKYLCNQAIYYEDLNYDFELYNWLDHRMYPYKDHEWIEYTNQCKRDNINFFIKKKSMAAWCHGSPGIYLSRYDAKFNNTKISKNSKSSRVKIKNHSICHGEVGNVLCLLNFDKHKNNKHFRNEIQVLCEKIMGYYRSNKSFISGYNQEKNNPSLFLGDLGVFYFMIKTFRYLNNMTVGSNILYPIINIKEKSKELHTMFRSYNCRSVAYKVLSNTYPRTCFYINEDKFRLQSYNSLEHSFLKFANNDIVDHVAKDAFDYECKLRKADTNIKSYSYTYLRNKVDLTYIDLISENLITTNFRVKLNSDVTLIESQWNWNTRSNPKWTLNSSKLPSHYDFVVIPSYNTDVLELSTFILDLIKFISSHPSISVDEITNYYIVRLFIDVQQQNEFKNIIIKNLIGIIQKGIIHIHHENI